MRQTDESGRGGRGVGGGASERSWRARRGMSAIALALAALAACGAGGLARQAGGPAAVQPAPGAGASPAAAPVPPAAPPKPTVPAKVETPEEQEAAVVGVAARGLARVAVVDLKFTQQPGVADYAAAAELLRVAHELAPTDQQLLRLLIEASVSQGDYERVNALTRELLVLDPEDTVAQLGLISSRITRLQSSDVRLAAYDAMLGPKGDQLDASIRSRLALDSALLLRERGDADAFVQRLRLAVKLDGTNRDAAGLLSAFVLAGDESALARLEAQTLLLYADPIDPGVHLAVARELAAGGAYKGARRFFENAQVLTETIEGNRAPGAYAESLVCGWAAEGAEGTVKAIADILLKPRRNMEMTIERLKASGEDASKAPQPSSFRIPGEVERVWAAAASAANDERMVDLAFVELTQRLGRIEAALADPAARSEFGEERLRNDLETFSADLNWLRVLANRQLDEVDKWLASIRDNPRVNRDIVARYDGWLNIRRGVVDAGEPVLKALAPGDPLALLGLAASYQASDRKGDAAAAYGEAAGKLTGTMEGAWAASRYQQMAGKAMAPAASAADLEAFASGIPKWADEMARDPRRFMLLQAKVLTSSIGPTERMGIEIRLRNVAPIPLALGAEKTMNSRLLVAPKIDIGARQLPTILPEVVNLERRLRLMPKQELVVTVWPDGGYTPWLVEMAMGELTRQRWRVLQGFRVGEGGVTSTGPMSLSTETDTVVRRPFSLAGADVSTMAAAVTSAKGTAWLDAVGSLRYRMLLDERGIRRFTPDEAKLASDTLAARYASGTRSERLALLAMIPTGQFFRCSLALDEALLRQDETDIDVAMVKILTRAVDPADALVRGALASPAPRVKLAGEIMRDRLLPGVNTYSRMKSGVPPPQPEGASVETGGDKAGFDKADAKAKPGEGDKAGAPEKKVP